MSCGIQIPLYHTSGLSTPQQSFMALLALTHLVNAPDDAYIAASKSVVNDRYRSLMKSLGMPADESAANAKYYALIDVLELSKSAYGGEFAAWFSKSYEEIDFLYKLAGTEGVVLMYGPRFAAPAWTLRVSLANLPDEAYTEIGRRILELLASYHAEFLSRAGSRIKP